MNNRHLLGITECLCRTCAPSGGNWRRYVKRDTRRFLRHTAAQQIREEMNSDSDHNADADYMFSQIYLNIENARNLRSTR